MMFAILVLTGAALVGIAIGAGPMLTNRLVATGPALDVITGCQVTDGDTIRCGDERIRLLGIDAPELPGHCRTGRACAPGDPYASTSSLEAAMTGELHIRRVGKDRYGRTLALVAGANGGEPFRGNRWGGGAGTRKLLKNGFRRRQTRSGWPAGARVPGGGGGLRRA